MALTKYLRDTVDARFTNKAAKITNAEYDETLRSFHDEIDAINAQLIISQGGALFGVQEVTTGGDDWNGSSRIVSGLTDDGAIDLQLLTADTQAGAVVTVVDANGNAGTNNVTITTEGTEKINGADTYVINTNYGSVTLVGVEDAGIGGINWVVIASA